MRILAQRVRARNHFTLRIEHEGAAWLVIARNHRWLNGDRNAAPTDAREIADGFGVGVEVRP